MSVIQQVDCPQCHLALKPAMPLPAGTLVKCPRCGKQFTTPKPALTPAMPSPGMSAPPKAAVVTASPVPPKVNAPIAAVAAPPAPNQTSRLVVWAITLLGGTTLLAVTACLLAALYFLPDPPAKVTKKDDKKDEQLAQDVPKTPQKKPKPPPPLPKVDPRPPPDAKVTEFVQRGVAYLKQTQLPSGGWGQPVSSTLHLGISSLAGLTLVSCDVKADDPAVQRAAAFVRARSSAELPPGQETYQVALAILFLDKLNDPSDKALIEKLTMRLVASQKQSGGWTYGSPMVSDADCKQLLGVLRKLQTKSAKDILASRSGQTTPLPAFLQGLAMLQSNANLASMFTRPGDDNSNTQFAVLALLAAQKHDIPLDGPLTLVAQRFRNTQLPNGGWNYTEKLQDRFSMTCAGLLGYAVGFSVSKDFSAFRPADDPQVQKALAYLSEKIGGGNPFLVDEYTLWSLERVAFLFQLDQINGKDWYSWGKELLYRKQQPDGRIPATGNLDANEPVVTTCFGMLFMHRVNLVQDLSETIRSRGLP